MLAIWGLWEVSGHIPCKLWQAASFHFHLQILLKISPVYKMHSLCLFLFALLFSLLFFIFQVQVRQEYIFISKYSNNIPI